MSSLFRSGVAIVLVGFASALCAQQDYTLPNVPYVCNGERLVIENCNIRDNSDTSTCMVGHPDHIQPNGLMQYTNMTKGAIKQLFPTCKQPTPDQVARAKAFQKRQQDAYNANEKKANDENDAVEARARAVGTGKKPMTPDERKINRCITSGRLASSCTGNALLGAFRSMLSSVLPSAGEQKPVAGPTMAGVFDGAGGWRLDFIDGGVLVNCAGLAPNQEAYTLNLQGGRPTITVNTRPRPLVLTLRADGTIAGPPGPVTIDGVVAGGYTAGTSTPGHSQTSTYTTTERMNANQVQPAGANTTNTNVGGGAYDAATTHTSTSTVGGSSTPGYTNFVPRRATCSAINLHSSGATGMQTMQTDLLKGMLGGDKGPPTPPGIRMEGIYAAASTGFSVQFFPESAVLGCGPDAARAYPYTVVPEGAGAVVKIAAPDHPLTLALKADNTLDPGAGPYQVHGRTVTGQDNNDNFTFAPMELTCNMAVLAPVKEIPSGGGLADKSVAGGHGDPLPGMTAGSSTLAIISGLPAQGGVPNALAVHPYTLLRDSLAHIVESAGVTVPPGSSPYKVLAIACANRTPDCQKMSDGIKAKSAFAVRSDANGAATFTGLAPGMYYLMISTRYNNQALVWSQPVQVGPGANSVTLDVRNATPIN